MQWKCNGPIPAVRHLRAIIAGEPDLVHAVVETNDAVGRHHLPHVVHDTLRGERKAALVGPLAGRENEFPGHRPTPASQEIRIDTS
jgi:hypothetical protein